MFHASTHTRVNVPCLIHHTCLCSIPFPTHVFVPRLTPHTCLCSVSHPTHVFMFHASFITRVYVPHLTPHTCLCSMPHPSHVCTLNTSSFVKRVCSLPPPHIFTCPVPHTSPYLRRMPHASYPLPRVTVPRSVHSLPHYRPVLSGDLSTVAQRPWQNKRDPE